jgi:formamidopyrimidine-DNA glycosylase
MPELPEVETTCRGISPYITGKKITDIIVRQPKLRWPTPRRLDVKLAGEKIIKVSRRAKYLLIETGKGTLIMHLGMSGSLRILSASIPAMAHDHFDLVFGKQCLRLRDPRRFGAVLWTDKPVEQHDLIKSLGPEPLSHDFDTDYLFTKSRKRQVNIKNFIMNSHIVVGVGNIYASESLFLAGINPKRKAGSISRKRYDKLVKAIKAVLSRAIKEGGTTLQDFSNAEGKPGYFAQQLSVYGRAKEACNQCDAPIQKITQGQRSTYFCPHCQT